MLGVLVFFLFLVLVLLLLILLATLGVTWPAVLATGVTLIFLGAVPHLVDVLRGKGETITERSVEEVWKDISLDENGEGV